MSVLQEILTSKQDEIRERQRSIPLASLQSRIDGIRDFRSALSGDRISVVAEVKRKSPSQGEISHTFDHVRIAKSYEQNGASALSVLTDEKYFGGSLEFLQDIRASVKLPVLQKDFIISTYQIWESYHAGADAILLILDALETQQVREYYQLAKELGLHVLVETHSREGMEKMDGISPQIVGINARNLHTMNIEFSRMLVMRQSLPEFAITVAESGMTASRHLKQAREAGYHAALVGTALMSTENPGSTLAEFIRDAGQGE